MSVMQIAWTVIKREVVPTKPLQLTNLTPSEFNEFFVNSVQQTRDAIGIPPTSGLELLGKHPPPTTAQFGFRPHRSTTDAVDKLIKAAFQSFEDGGFAGATLCDLSKAFDMVDHDTLLGKLNFYGVKGKLFELFESYLTGLSEILCTTEVVSVPPTSVNTFTAENLYTGAPKLRRGPGGAPAR
ncbi:uncharacterized protein LOC128985230 [Macrosteles quadrilineatus]|uniref:uncharacterized protein LOC128985230 n=1 Tax=Macrosteles quadrilineatus TaxID=74068 RepID=UPI0023E32FD8|nr:uncharacterized protein LOC128985230 [Macrosteles quadrilineatus]